MPKTETQHFSFTFLINKGNATSFKRIALATYNNLFVFN